MSQGRKVIVCKKCGKNQSTHSTNREYCHECVPKCKEINTFPLKKEEIKKN